MTSLRRDFPEPGARRKEINPVLNSAEKLRRALEPLEIAGDVHEGYGLALVSGWVELVVWCNGTGAGPVRDPRRFLRSKAPGWWVARVSHQTWA